MRCRVADRRIYDGSGVLIAECPVPEASEYIVAALDLLAYVRERLKVEETICIRLNEEAVEVGTLDFEINGFDCDGRAKTIDAAVREALETRP